MARQFAIVPANWPPARYLAYAQQAGVKEITIGVPPRLRGMVDPTSLPMVFTEIIPPFVLLPTPEDQLMRINARIDELEKRFGVGGTIGGP